MSDFLAAHSPNNGKIWLDSEVKRARLWWLIRSLVENWQPRQGPLPNANTWKKVEHLSLFHCCVEPLIPSHPCATSVWVSSHPGSAWFCFGHQNHLELWLLLLSTYLGTTDSPLCFESYYHWVYILKGKHFSQLPYIELIRWFHNPLN